jgi:hypothetical protein
MMEMEILSALTVGTVGAGLRPLVTRDGRVEVSYNCP